MITGISLQLRVEFISFNTSQPSFLGMVTPSIMVNGFSLAAFLKSSMPSLAVITSYEPSGQVYGEELV